MAATIVASTIAAGSAGAGQPFNIDEWTAFIEVAARNFRVTAPLVREFKFKGPADQLNIPVIGTVTAADFTQAMEEGNAATIAYSMPTSNTKAITPSMSYAALKLAQREVEHSKYDLQTAWQDELAEALAQFEDQKLIQYFQNAAFTNTQLGSTTTNYTEALVLAQFQSLRTNAQSKAKVGRGGNSHLVYHSAQIDDLFAIPMLTSYFMTARDNGPLVTGDIPTALGYDLHLSDNVYVSGGAAYMPLFSKEALAMARLYKPKGRMQFLPDNVAWAIVMWQEFGYVALNPTASTIVIGKST
jgi:hypothetical protein